MTTANVERETVDDDVKKEEQSSKEQAKPKSTFKTGRYSEFTGFYGVFQAFGGFKNRSCISRHDSIEEANETANTLFESYTKNDDSVGCDEIMRTNPFQAFATVGYGSNTFWVDVDELKIEKCQLAQLKTIALREDVNISDYKSKKKLLEKLIPIIEHKKHLNRYEDINFDKCEICQINDPNGYTKWKEEKEKDPMVIRGKLISNMYRKKLFNPMKEKDVKAKYGFTEDELEKAVLDQQIHFQRKCCFGNQYRLYERNEVIKYHEKMQKLKQEKCKENEKRTILDFTHLACANEPDKKKRKLQLDDCKNENTDNIDYKGVPVKFRNYKWLYKDCSELTDDGRNKIMDYMIGKYKRNDVETEDVLLNRVESVDGDVKVIKRGIFRMYFKTKKWKKLKISRKVNIGV